MVRTMFAVARKHQPAVIFMDEIDSLLSQRTDKDVESTRRIKTEFLVQFDGCGHARDTDRILIVGATNRPQEIDEAARRRFGKRLYIPLPDRASRITMTRHLLKGQVHSVEEEGLELIGDKTEGYSGSDMDGLCREAALGPIREIQDIVQVKLEEVRPMTLEDFLVALTQVRQSVGTEELEGYRSWNAMYGSLAE